MPKIAARAAASTSASSKMTYGALPPSSRLTRFTSMPAWAPIRLPVPVSPVNEILSTFLLGDELRADDGPRARDQVEHTIRETGLLDELDQLIGGGRGVARRL